MFRHIAKLSIIILVLLSLCGCQKDEPFTMVVASDIHYIGNDLHDDGYFFNGVLDSGDGKIVDHSEEILDEFIREVIDRHPDVLLITGDITFNGEYVSHEEVKRKLDQVKEAGIDVLVLPGNHDVYNSMAASFSGNGYEYIQGTTTEDFYSIYHDYYENVLSKDENSLSVVYEINKGNRILLLDTNTFLRECNLAKGTLEFVEDALKEAKKDNVNLIVAGHQNLFKHSIFDFGYVIIGADKLIELFKKYEMPLFLSGHMHIQHIVTSDNISEVCTSALSIYPLQYGIIQYEKGRYTYDTCELNTDLRDFAKKRICYVNELKSLSRLEEDVEDREELAMFNGELNATYFKGDLTDIEKYKELFDRWISLGTGSTGYLEYIYNERGSDFRHLEIER